MGQFEVVFFDLDHTLVDTRGQYDKGIPMALRELYGTDVPENFLEHFMKHHNKLWALYDKRELSMPELRRQRFLRAWEDFNVSRSVEEADTFQKVYDATFEATLHAYPGTYEFLEQLAQSYKLGIITNGSQDMQWRKLTISGLQDFFAEKNIVNSVEFGHAKPHPAVFEAACRQLNTDKTSAVMVGDNYLSDVEGARSFGMAALWYVPDAVILEGQQAFSRNEPVLRQPRELPAAIRRLESAQS